MTYPAYLELRRRAEKRLMVLKAGPLLSFQIIFYGLMVIRAPYDGGVPLLAAGMSICIIAAMFVLYRVRTAANRKVRRAAIDGALEDMVETGWPLEDPSPRQLRLLAVLLDDDLETRAGYGRALIWSSIAAAIGWVLTLWQISYLSVYRIQGYGLEFLAFWLLLLGGLTLYHQRARKAAERRVRAALDGTSSWNTAKPKRLAEAPWWHDEDDAPGEKPKRTAWDDEAELLIGDDGELNGGNEAAYRLT